MPSWDRKVSTKTPKIVTIQTVGIAMPYGEYQAAKDLYNAALERFRKNKKDPKATRGQLLRHLLVEYIEGR